MGNLWRRRIIVEIGGARWEYPPYYITGQVLLQARGQPAQAKVRLFNLALKSMNAIRRRMEMTISAGHEEATVRRIFLGVVNQVSAEWTRTESILHVKAQEKRVEVLHKRLPGLSFAPGVSAEDVVREVFRSVGIEPAVVDGGGLRYEKHGYNLDPQHTVARALDELADDVGRHTGRKWVWYVAGGRGYFVADGTPTGLAWTLTPKTGLIRFPLPAADVTTDEEHEHAQDFVVESVLLPGIQPGDTLTVQSKRNPISGTVESVTHTFSPDGEFRTTVVVRRAGG